MAEIAHTAAGTAGKADLTTLAQEVQMQSQRAFHLLAAIDVAIDEAFELSADEHGQRRRGDAINQMTVFSQMAREAARKAGEAGEAIERYDYHARHSLGREGAVA